MNLGVFNDQANLFSQFSFYISDYNWVLMLNNKRKYFYIHSFICLVLFYKRNEYIFLIKFILLLFIK